MEESNQPDAINLTDQNNEENKAVSEPNDQNADTDPAQPQVGLEDALALLRKSRRKRIPVNKYTSHAVEVVPVVTHNVGRDSERVEEALSGNHAGRWK